MQGPKEAPPSGSGLLIRLYWLFFCNVVLIFILAFIIEKHPQFPSLLDAAYLAALSSLIIIRYVDIRFFDGQTGEGKPATIDNWRRYALLVGLAGPAVWFVSRVLAHVLK